MSVALTAVFDFWTQAWEIWRSGGWGMLAIAVNAVLLFSIGLRIQSDLRAKEFRRMPEKIWRRWIHHPLERQGPIGAMIEFVSGGRTLRETAVRFQELRSTETVPLARDLRLMKVCVGVAPLLGLLGTVTGMLTTFGALASGGGGEKTMALIAKGISEALITTETGLVIALPGLLYHHQLSRGYEHYRSFLAHLETVCAQHVYRTIHHHAVKSGSRGA